MCFFENLQQHVFSFGDTHNVTTLTVTLLVQGVEGLPSEASVTGDAREALHVKHLLHGDATAPIANNIVTATRTAA